MITIYLYTFASVVAVSLISFIGVLTLSLREEIIRKYIYLFISVAVGALLGDALIHLIPESFEESGNLTLTSILVISGVLLFFILEKFLHWHHHGEDKEKNHVEPVGKLILLSDGIHNFIDGIIIGASFMVGIPVGLATTLAVILHEIPQEVGDFAVLIHSGYTKRRALWLNFLSGVSAILGALTFFALGEGVEISSSVFVPMAAGGFIYIAVADLIPDLQKTRDGKNSLSQIVSVLIGVLVMVALTYLE